MSASASSYYLPLSPERVEGRSEVLVRICIYYRRQPINRYSFSPLFAYFFPVLYWLLHSTSGNQSTDTPLHVVFTYILAAFCIGWYYLTIQPILQPILYTYIILPLPHPPTKIPLTSHFLPHLGIICDISIGTVTNVD